MNIKIAIDGPSGSGKSTLAKNIAKKLGIVYVDTGALYRSIGLYAKRCGIDKAAPAEVIPHLADISVSLEYDSDGQKVILNGEDVSGLIRTPEISMYASAVSAVPEVRSFLLGLQRKMADAGNVVMDGRDIGTVIMPDADVKLFLSPNPQARAERRCAELREKGIECTPEEVLADIMKRDSNDKNRAVAPAVPAEDAIFLDNSAFLPEETLKAALDIIEKALNSK